jgi:hypothetical protein
MSTDSSNTLRRERALRSARRRLRLLEIETHRIKAELARLEAEFEDELADRLSGTSLIGRDERARDGTPAAHRRVDGPHERATVFAIDAPSAWAGPPESASSFDAIDLLAGELPQGRPRPMRRRETIQPQVEINSDEPRPTSALAAGPQGWLADYRRARPFMLSLGIHVLALCALLPMTIATIAKQQLPLVASPSFRPDESLAEFDDVEITPAAMNDSQPQRVVFDDSKVNLGDGLLGELLPIEPAIGSGAVAIPNALASDLSSGGAMELGRETAGGQGTGDAPGSLTFFGTKSLGNRFVFVVDNSSSMKDGRLEAAIDELKRSVEALGRRQAFYVIFVADQPYPMFFPEPAPQLLLATPENKQLLTPWLGKVRLASGKNRELIKAVNMAAALRPDAVFLLWDADLKYSDAVRQEVMNHLTSPQPWNFTIHTLGMGTLSPESEQNLAAIAQAHGGTYRRIDVQPPAVR